jgi:hypothetical protein
MTQNGQPQPGPAIDPAQDIDVNLTIKISQVNMIIAGLDELPHKFSRPVIDAIHQQVMPQVQAAQQNGGNNGLTGDLAGKARVVQ